MKRRQLLAGAAALPVAGLVMPASASDDPAVRAFHAWRHAWQALHVSYRSRDDEESEQDRLHDVEFEAGKAIAEAVATTPAGLLGQLVLALDTFGTMRLGGEGGIRITTPSAS